MTGTEQRCFEKSPDSQWKDSWQRIGLQRVSSTCTSWPLIPERRWLVSFTFTADTASRHDTPSLSPSCALVKLTAFITLHTNSRRQTRMPCSTSTRSRMKSVLRVKHDDTHHFHCSTIPFLFFIRWQYWALCYRNKSYKHATEWQPAWLNINVICELGMASKYRHWHHLSILEYLNIIRENEQRGGWHWRYQHKSTPEITTSHYFWMFSVMTHG